jgi:hypothetical protein
MTTLSHIVLELARGPGHPFGDRRKGYHLYLPLSADGRIDAAACGQNHHYCRVRKFAPGAAERCGRIVRGPGGKWMIDYAEDAPCQEARGFHLDAERFAPGECVQIRDDDGTVHAFQVILVRPE